MFFLCNLCNLCNKILILFFCLFGGFWLVRFTLFLNSYFFGFKTLCEDFVIYFVSRFCDLLCHILCEKNVIYSVKILWPTLCEKNVIYSVKILWPTLSQVVKNRKKHCQDFCETQCNLCNLCNVFWHPIPPISPISPNPK